MARTRHPAAVRSAVTGILVAGLALGLVAARDEGLASTPSAVTADADAVEFRVQASIAPAPPPSSPEPEAPATTPDPTPAASAVAPEPAPAPAETSAPAETPPPVETPPPPPPAEPAPPPCGPSCRVDRALSGLGWAAPAGWSVVGLPGRDGLLGMTYQSSSTVEMYVRDGLSDTTIAFVLAHELAHAWDIDGFSQQDRQRWLDARGLDWDVADWFGGPDRVAGDLALPAGDFAESVAACLVGPSMFASELGGVPTGAQCELARGLVGA